MTIVQLLMWYDKVKTSSSGEYPDLAMYFIERVAEKLAQEGIGYGDQFFYW
jgi:hypothetical protein